MIMTTNQYLYKVKVEMTTKLIAHTRACADMMSAYYGYGSLLGLPLTKEFSAQKSAETKFQVATGK